MRNLALTLLSFVVLLLVLEVLLRTTHAFNARVSFTEPDTLIGWRLTPGKTFWFNGENDHPVTGRINNLGFRGRNWTRTKPVGTYRIAVLGDSFVEAFQVEDDSTFVAIVERALAARWRTPVEAMNFGRSGMTQTEELLVLERDVIPCAPDLVVLVFVPDNDVRDVAPATADRAVRPFFLTQAGDLRLDTSFRSTRGYRLRERVNFLKQHSALVSLATERYNVLRRTGATVPPGSEEARSAMTAELSMCTATPDSVYVDNYRLNKRLILAIHAACAAHGIDMMLAAVPLVYRDEEAGELRAIDGSFRSDFFERDLEALADSCGIGFVPLLEPFERRYRATRESLRWSHWNYAGHRAVAREIAAAIASRREAPVPAR